MASRLTAGHALSVGWVDDDVAVEAHLQAVVLADVGVVPVDAVVGEPQSVDELAADGDGGLGLVGHAVVGVVAAGGRASARWFRGRRRCAPAPSTSEPCATRRVGPGMEPL